MFSHYSSCLRSWQIYLVICCRKGKRSCSSLCRAFRFVLLFNSITINHINIDIVQDNFWCLSMSVLSRWQCCGSPEPQCRQTNSKTCGTRHPWKVSAADETYTPLVHLTAVLTKFLVFVFFFLSLVGGLSEVCVCSAEEAYALYETCGERLKANAGSISSR